MTHKNKVFADLVLETLRVPQTAMNGLNAILGMWPGNESDEEIQEALERLRRDMNEFPVPDKIIPKKIT